jgi:hypothetical protein
MSPNRQDRPWSSPVARITFQFDLTSVTLSPAA